MRFKEGDQVIVREMEEILNDPDVFVYCNSLDEPPREIGARYKTDDGHNKNDYQDCWFVGSMMKKAGKVCTIDCIIKLNNEGAQSYRLVEDKGAWNWVDWMLKPVQEEPAIEINIQEIM